MSAIDVAAEAARIVERHEAWLARIPAASAKFSRGPTRTELDPFRYTAEDAAAIDALVGDDIDVRISDRPETYEPGYCFCCEGPCRQGRS